MNKEKFSSFMKMRSKAPLGGSGLDAPDIDSFFEDFIKADPTKAQFIAMLNGSLATATHMYVLWKTK